MIFFIFKMLCEHQASISTYVSLANTCVEHKQQIMIFCKILQESLYTSVNFKTCEILSRAKLDFWQTEWRPVGLSAEGLVLFRLASVILTQVFVDIKECSTDQGNTVAHHLLTDAHPILEQWSVAPGQLLPVSISSMIQPLSRCINRTFGGSW